MAVMDGFGRPLRNLRLSVTDRCNLRCSYCMPEEEYRWLPRPDLLTFEEIRALVDAFADLGVTKIRLTGGEPLLRRGLPVLVAMLAKQPAIDDIAITTNGLLLAEQARPLADAGIGRFTVSLDTLRPDRYRDITRRDALEDVRRGIEAAAATGLPSLKLDAVIIRGTNDDELCDLIAYGRTVGAEVRFIEYMDVGGATRWSHDAVVSRDEMLAIIGRTLGPATPLSEISSAPANRYRLLDGTIFGIIASTTAPFCGSCDRSRLTADGMWYLCLYARAGLDLRGPLRAGASRSELAALITPPWTQRSDRGAEERLGLAARAPLATAHDLAKDPHLEMHARGG
ncbi:MAG: GTP 3',8-cyclase MoaA [Acidobacteriota bacterium]